MHVIIPAYKPDEKLIHLLEALREIEGLRVVVVNDGSGDDFAPIFEKAKPLCHRLLVHSENRGKGAALKTAFAYLAEQGLENEAICTADADGQHLPEDIITCLKEAALHPDSLVLGIRKFNGKVPARSRFGNTVARHTFRLLMGQNVYDTQTGLRAFTSALLPEILAIKGDRYEYEMQMLCDMVKKKIPLRQVEIETVYLNENSSSHFNPVKDAIKIYGLLFQCAWGSFFEMLCFVFSSLIAFVVDIVMFTLLHDLLFKDFPAPLDITLPLVIARITSSTLNFFVNRKVVFHNMQKPWRSVFLYLCLIAIVAFGNNALDELFMNRWHWNSTISHALAQAICFPVSFISQKYVVFPKSDKQ